MGTGSLKEYKRGRPFFTNTGYNIIIICMIVILKSEIIINSGASLFWGP